MSQTSDKGDLSTELRASGSKLAPGGTNRQDRPSYIYLHQGLLKVNDHWHGEWMSNLLTVRKWPRMWIPPPGPDHPPQKSTGPTTDRRERAGPATDCRERAGPPDAPSDCTKPSKRGTGGGRPRTGPRWMTEVGRGHAAKRTKRDPVWGGAKNKECPLETALNTLKRCRRPVRATLCIPCVWYTTPRISL